MESNRTCPLPSKLAARSSQLQANEPPSGCKLQAAGCKLCRRMRQ